MPRIRLTPERIRTFGCAPGQQQAFLWDTESPGLAVRTTQAGAKAFIFQAKLNGSTIRSTIGDARTDLDKARAEARKLQTLIDQGIDPREVEREKEVQKAAEAAAKAAAAAEAQHRSQHTLKALCEAYVRYLEGRNKKRSAGAVRSAFKVHVYPSDIADKPARDLTSIEGAGLVRKVQEAGKERMAGILRSYLLTAYNIARKAPLSASLPAELIPFAIESNPFDIVPAIPGKTRSRTLSAEELNAYVSHLGDALPDQALLLALLAGGQRISQLLRVKVSDYDEHTATLRLFDPKGKRSSPREHLIPLATRGAKLAAALVKRAKKIEATQLFEVGGGTCLAMEAAGKRVADICATMNGERFDLLDIRRTVETMLAELRISRDTRAQLLSHGITGVQATHYDRHAYMDEKREALIAWEARIKDIEAGRFHNEFGMRGRGHVGLSIVPFSHLDLQP